MNLSKLFALNKRQKFVLSVFLLTLGIFASEFFPGISLIGAGIVLAVLTDIFLFLILKEDISGTSFYPLLILPFFYTISFVLFYSLLPQRLLSRIALTALYAFGLYSLFLTQNIFAVSNIRTINLLRSARIVAFVISIFTLFFFIHVIFSLGLPVFITPFPIFLIVFLISFQSIWSYLLDNTMLKDAIIFSLIIALCMFELSYVVLIWPVNATLYAIFLTGIFYTYLAMIHAWVDKRLFKGVLWEYAWVGILSLLILIIFSDWGI